MKKYGWYDGIGYLLPYQPIILTEDQVEMAAHQGECYDDARYVAEQIKDQLAMIPAEIKVKVLSEVGAWDETELQDESENDIRLVWIAANDIKENKDLYREE